MKIQDLDSTNKVELVDNFSEIKISLKKSNFIKTSV